MSSYPALSITSPPTIYLILANLHTVNTTSLKQLFILFMLIL